MRVLVCGGREFTNWLYISRALDIVHEARPVEMLIHGGARGVDTLAGYWAHKRGIYRRVFPAAWIDEGPAAGPIRNRRMLIEGNPELVIAFPGGRGTANMVAQAIAAQVPIIRLDGRTLPAAQKVAEIDRPNGGEFAQN